MRQRLRQGINHLFIFLHLSILHPHVSDGVSVVLGVVTLVLTLRVDVLGDVLGEVLGDVPSETRSLKSRLRGSVAQSEIALKSSCYRRHR
ncbi:hypothetical protein F2Q68_00043044 [Brassica cretica]|uniref:Uncharacterized protein n=1 Tax=Brassica cretica TaxID=69181 RepID=A0A8S9LMK1_BRACR|nr:hypothetical protein F2Q68_00043044 [Brassica cretica]